MGSERPPGPRFDELRLPGLDEELEPTELGARDRGRAPEHEVTEALRPDDPTAERPGPAPGLDGLGEEPYTAELPLLELDTEERAPPAAPPAPAPPLVEIPWRGLHPASLVINLLPQTWRVALGFWPLLLAAAVGGQRAGLGLEDGFFLVLVLGSGGLSTLVHYLTLRYRVHEGRLELRQGLLNRQARSIDPARIQNVTLVRNPLHRLAGLVEVRLETAGDTRTEGLLSALTAEDAERLVLALSPGRGTEPAPTAEVAPPMLHNSAVELVALGLSRPNLGAVFLVWVVGSELLAVLGPGQAEDVAALLTPVRAAALGLLAFGVSWLGSGILSLFRHFGFTLRATVGADGRPRLRGEQGLLTRTVVEVPLRKVQLALAEEPWLRRAMGYGTVAIETAGSGMPGEGEAAELVLPMVERERLGELFRAALPEAGLDPWTEPLDPPPARALGRALLSATLRALALGGLGAVVWMPLAGVGLLLLPPMWLGAWLDHRAQGWRLTPTALAGREGFWRRHTWTLPRAKVQSVHLRQGVLLRRWRLARVVVRAAGAQVALPLLDEDQARALQDALTAA